MGWQSFQVEHRDQIAVIRIDRPPVNAIDLEFAREADQVLERVIASEGPSAVVMAGTGTSFSAGLDLKCVPLEADFVEVYGFQNLSAVTDKTSCGILNLHARDKSDIF